MLKLLVTTKTVHKSAAVRSGRILQEIRPSFESGKALIMARYPGPDPARRDETAEAEVNAIIEQIRKIRNVRAEFRINLNRPLGVAVVGHRVVPLSSAQAAVIQRLAKVGQLKADRNDAVPTADEVAVALTSGAVAVRLGNLVDLDRGKNRLSEEISNIDGNIKRLNALVQDEKFLERAPEEVVAHERERLKTLQERRSLVDEILSRLT